jgi:hypothetical protein
VLAVALAQQLEPPVVAMGDQRVAIAIDAPVRALPPHEPYIPHIGRAI